MHRAEQGGLGQHPQLEDVAPRGQAGPERLAQQRQEGHDPQQVEGREARELVGEVDEGALDAGSRREGESPHEEAVEEEGRVAEGLLPLRGQQQGQPQAEGDRCYHGEGQEVGAGEAEGGEEEAVGRGREVPWVGKSLSEEAIKPGQVSCHKTRTVVD